MSDCFEVEKKYPLSSADKRRVEKRLKKLGFVYVDTRHLQDRFIPGTRKGERLRVRQEGNHHFVLTFKEKMVIGGRKTQRESEPEIHAIAAHLIVDAATRELKDELPTLYKVRKDYKGVWGDFIAHVVIDYAPELSKTYSEYFMEVEILVKDAGKIKAAKKAVKEIARKIFGEKRKPAKLTYRRMLFKTLKTKKRFPKRWSKVTGRKKGRLDPRDTGKIGADSIKARKKG